MKEGFCQKKKIYILDTENYFDKCPRNTCLLTNKIIDIIEKENLSSAEIAAILSIFTQIKLSDENTVFHIKYIQYNDKIKMHYFK